jgi:hypothetical protein
MDYQGLEACASVFRALANSKAFDYWTALEISARRVPEFCRRDSHCLRTFEHLDKKNVPMTLK